MKTSKLLDRIFWITLIIGSIFGTFIFPDSRKLVMIIEAVIFIILFSVANKELKGLGR